MKFSRGLLSLRAGPSSRQTKPNGEFRATGFIYRAKGILMGWLKRRREFKADPLDQNRDDGEVLSDGLDDIEDNANWLGELSEEFATPWNDPTVQVDRSVFGRLPVSEEPGPVPLPAGAVLNRQDIYEGGRRCLNCRVPAVADLCSRCAIGGPDAA